MVGLSLSLIHTMSQRSFDGTTEVTWDNDSPTPIVWKRLQGEPIQNIHASLQLQAKNCFTDPSRNDDDVSESPKLLRVTVRHHF